jgi:hypothetical protein
VVEEEEFDVVAAEGGVEGQEGGDGPAGEAGAGGEGKDEADDGGDGEGAEEGGSEGFAMGRPQEGRLRRTGKRNGQFSERCGAR